MTPPPAPTISEAQVLDALRSVSFADEIIVVDSHSTDATREIAREFRGRSRDGEEVRPRVVERDWPGHVEQKRFAVESASHDRVLCLDADVTCSPDLVRSLLAHASRTGVQAFSVATTSWVDEPTSSLATFCPK